MTIRSRSLQSLVAWPLLGLLAIGCGHNVPFTSDATNQDPTMAGGAPRNEGSRDTDTTARSAPAVDTITPDQGRPPAARASP
ncbi:MAG: hypothetical protein ACYTHJ_16190 [Planctomycetota bacterium]